MRQSDKDTPLHSFTFQKIKKFLFVNQKGKPKVAIDYNALFVRMVKKYNKQHKDNPLPHITPHTLRHTFCTRLASKNMNPKDLQYIMGHSNISITMNWYAHASIDTAKSEVQWAFQGIKTPMGVATYDNIRLQEIKSQLPSEEAIQKRLEQAEEYILKLKEKNK